MGSTGREPKPPIAVATSIGYRRWHKVDSTRAGAAQDTDCADVMYSTAGAGAAYTAGIDAMYSTTGAGADGGLDRERTEANYRGNNRCCTGCRR